MVKIIRVLIFLSAAILLMIGACVPVNDRMPVEKNGRRYGITEGAFRHRWWNYYERALSFADGGFWKEAELDLREATRQRHEDQRRALTYGLHLADYFPHRELGVVLFHQGRSEEAVKELELSLSMAKSAKTEFYLDRVRKAMSNADREIPEIIISSPKQPFLTNAFSVTIAGIDRDKNGFVRHIRVGDKEVRTDVAKQEIDFQGEIPISPGINKIPVRAVNLAGISSETFVIVNVDNTGPLLSIDKLSQEAKSSEKIIAVNGYASDASGLAELDVNGTKIPVDHSPTELNFRQSVSVKPEISEITIKAKDYAGNITSALVPLSEPAARNENNILLVENTETIASDAVKKRTSSFVRIELHNPLHERVTYSDQAVADGIIRSDQTMVKLFINGHEIISTPRKITYFSHRVKLETGDNYIDMMAVAPSRHSDTLMLKIKRLIPSVRKPESRMKLAINTFIRRVTSDVNVQLNVGFESRLTAAARSHEPARFSGVENPNLGEDEEKALKTAKNRGFHCVLFGEIEERKNSANKSSFIIKAWIRDTDDGSLIVSDTDVYAEDADADNSDYILKSLAQDLKLKLIDEMPVAEGVIRERRDRYITVDLGNEAKIKKGMNLIVFRSEESEDADSKDLGAARITKVEQKESVANLIHEKNKEVIRSQDRVITR